MNKIIKKSFTFQPILLFLFVGLLLTNVDGVSTAHAQSIANVVDKKQSPLFFNNLKQISPNKAYIALVSADNLGMIDAAIWITNADGTNRQKIVKSKDDFWVTNPIWSPDSKKIAYLKVIEAQKSHFEINARYEIWVIDKDGSNNTMLTDSLALKPTLGYGGQTTIAWKTINQIIFFDETNFPAQQYAISINTLTVRKLGTVQHLEVGIQSQPVNVPYFSQKDGQWGADRLGTCSGVTINSAGCAMTATAMVLKYYGVNTDPRRLNAWLTNNGGYASGCLIYWAKAANLGSNIAYVGSVGTDWNRLRSELDAGYPIILEVNNGAHFVLATGYSGNTYYINDPASTNIKTLASYSNTFKSMRIYHGPIPNSKTYGSAWVSQSSYPTVNQGGYADLWVTFKNTGNTTWYNTYSPNRTHLGTLNPTNGAIDYLSPFFCTSSWVGNNRPAVLAESTVSPGNTGTFRFRICIPSNMQAGTYRIAVAPLVEGLSWMIPPGLVYWDVTVKSTISGSFNRLVAKHSNRCIDVTGGSKDNGASIIQWDCHGGDNQSWNLVSVGDYYKVVAKHSGKCLDVYGWSKDNGARLVQWDCHGGDNQLFRKESMGSYYRLRSKNSNKCIDVYGGSTNNGASIIQWDCHGGDNQSWSIQFVSAAATISGIEKNPFNEFVLPIAPSKATTLIKHKVFKGDSLALMAQVYQVSIKSILKANAGLKIGSIKPGQMINIPVSLLCSELHDGSYLTPNASSESTATERATCAP